MPFFGKYAWMIVAQTVVCHFCHYHSRKRVSGRFTQPAVVCITSWLFANNTEYYVITSGPNDSDSNTSDPHKIRDFFVVFGIRHSVSVRACIAWTKDKLPSEL